MTAAVYGRHSLDELQALVVDAFGPVVDQQLPVPSFSPDVFTDEVRGSPTYVDDKISRRQGNS
jgi:secreted Zn-dependent insulinase-like peptidase